MELQTIQLDDNSIAGQITSACLLEAASRKPGNVHPGASFSDLMFSDFARAAQLTGTALGQTRQIGIGQATLDAVSVTHRITGTNVNLGIVLLLAPLVAIPDEIDLENGVAAILQSLDLNETRKIFAAIRIASPGGMGTVKDQDISQPPDQSILYAMSLAAERDWIARQYVCNFEDLLKFGRNCFLQWFARTQNWETAIIGTQLSFLSRFPDSLIARKCGPEVAMKAGQRAQAVLAAGWPDSAEGHRQIDEFDQWLRADGNRRNPGTTADAIAAVLYSVMRDKMWSPPSTITISLDSGNA